MGRQSETPARGGAGVSTGRAARGGGSRAALPLREDIAPSRRGKRGGERLARVARFRSVLLELEPPIERAGLLLTDARAVAAFGLLEGGEAMAALVTLAMGDLVDPVSAAADPVGSHLAAGVLWCVEPEVWGVWLVAWERACARRPLRDPVGWSLEVHARSGGSAVELERLVWAWLGRVGE